jgi:DNA-nicking Smr family endonuclease
MPDICISITPVQIGHVVGKGGSTIKGIQERTGAKLEILQDGPQVKITADDDAQLEAAVAEVKTIVKNQEHPDYEGPEGARLRAEANALGDKRSKLFDEATKKREAGDHAAANALVAEGKQAGEEMQARHHAAAVAIAKYNNEDKGKGEDYFDMHGLREEEAMEMLKERVARLEAKPEGTVTDFEVIPGAGHHSAPGAQKLKGATEAFLREKGYTYEAVSAGSFLVKVPATGEAVISAPEEGDRKKPKVEPKPKAPAAAEKKPVEPTKKEGNKKDKKDRDKDKKKKEKNKSCCSCM